MKSDLTYCKKYFSDVGQRVYENHRKNSRKPFKISQVEDFMNFAEEKILKEKWSPDSVCGYAKFHNLFDEPVCTKTLYNSIEMRPPCANERIEFGHWEIDLIIGKRSKDEVLLTLKNDAIQTHYQTAG